MPVRLPRGTSHRALTLLVTLSVGSGCPLEFVADSGAVVGDEPEAQPEADGGRGLDAGSREPEGLPEPDGGDPIVDAGGPDAEDDAGVGELVDAGVIDAGVLDAGVDAGVLDAGVVDAGVVDAGVVDAGVVDAGVVDAGPTCGNGVLEFGEVCDDQNATDGDGCDSFCELEGATVCTPASDVELAINGGFLAGGFGFSSDAFLTNQLGCGPGSDPLVLAARVDENEAHLETSGDGVILIFDGLITDQTVLWSQSYSLQEGNTYSFVVDVGRTGIDPAPEVSITVNGTEVSRQNIVEEAAPTRVLVDFLAPANDVTIEILSHTQSCVGNNPTLDGISLVENSERSFCHQCGDGILGGSETCDEGGVGATDACDEECLAQPDVACAVPGAPCVTSTFRTGRSVLPRTGGRGIDVVTNCGADEMLVGFDTWPALLFGANVLGSMEPVCAERVFNVDGTLDWTNPRALSVNRGDKSGTRIETRCPANTFARGAVSQMETIGGYYVHTGLQFVCQEAVLAPIGIAAVGVPVVVESSVGAQPFNDPLVCDPTRWPVGMSFGIGQILDSIQVACAQNIATLSQ